MWLIEYAVAATDTKTNYRGETHEAANEIFSAGAPTCMSKHMLLYPALSIHPYHATLL
jgi:hypothetical protein